MTLKKIDANIRLITTNAAKLNGRIHDTAVLIAAHANEHGDCTRALTLVKAMPASMRRAMLILWFNTFTPIRVSLANDKVGMLKDGQKAFVAFNLVGGEAVPFYELAKAEKEAEDATLDDVREMIERLSKRVAKLVTEGKVAANDKGNIETLQGALTKLANVA